MLGDAASVAAREGARTVEVRPEEEATGERGPDSVMADPVCESVRVEEEAARLWGLRYVVGLRSAIDRRRGRA